MSTISIYLKTPWRSAQRSGGVWQMTRSDSREAMRVFSQSVSSQNHKNKLRKSKKILVKTLATLTDSQAEKLAVSNEPRLLGLQES